MKKIKLMTVSYGLLALLCVLFTVSIAFVYLWPQSSNRMTTFIKRAPYPLVVIGYRPSISFRELSQNIRAVRRFYENQDFSKIGLRVDFSTDDGKKRLQVREKEVLNKMLEDEAIILLAKERGIFVSAETARQAVSRKVEEYGSGTKVKENLERLYGWQLADFEKKIVLPSLYEEKLNESFLKEVDPASEAKTKIEKAADALRQNTDFASVVKEYSDGQVSENGGDVGWFTLEDLLPELRSPVALQKVGVPGSVVESSLGFHIIKVEEVKKEQDKTLYHLKQVFTKKETFADWLSEEMKTLSVYVLSREYRYNKETARIEFRDDAWRKYEEELYQKASGDASFFF